MTSTPVRKSRTKRVFERCYDYINDCDFSQLDAIMLAFLVFFIGCGVLVLLFIVGGIQSFTAQRKAPSYHAASPPPASVPVYYTARAQEPPQPTLEQRFGRPRADVQPFPPAPMLMSGQAQASTYPGY